MNQPGSGSAWTLALLTLPLVAIPAWAAAPPRVLEATGVRVVDCDTLVAETTDGTKLKIHVLGIDAPEVDRVNRKIGVVSKPGQPYAQEAKVSGSWGRGPFVARLRAKRPAAGPMSAHRRLAGPPPRADAYSAEARRVRHGGKRSLGFPVTGVAWARRG